MFNIPLRKRYEHAARKLRGRYCGKSDEVISGFTILSIQGSRNLRCYAEGRMKYDFAYMCRSQDRRYRASSTYIRKLEYRKAEWKNAIHGQDVFIGGEVVVGNKLEATIDFHIEYNDRWLMRYASTHI